MQCKDCVFWGRGESITENAKHGFKVCDLLNGIAYLDKTDEIMAEKKAVPVAEYGYDAFFETKADFGCTQFEPQKG